MKDANWPIFIAAPFMFPSASTIRSAVSMCARSTSASRRSLPRPTLRARAPA